MRLPVPFRKQRYTRAAHLPQVWDSQPRQEQTLHASSGLVRLAGTNSYSRSYTAFVGSFTATGLPVVVSVLPSVETS